MKTMPLLLTAAGAGVTPIEGGAALVVVGAALLIALLIRQLSQARQRLARLERATRETSEQLEQARHAQLRLDEKIRAQELELATAAQRLRDTESQLRTAVEASASRADSSRSEALSAAGEATVLFVDDEPAIANVSKRILERLGYRTLMANNAKDAISQFRSAGGIDVVITDQNMPETSGSELARQIREVDRDIPIILTTGFGDSGFSELLETGVISDVLPKPFSASDLTSALERVIQDRAN